MVAVISYNPFITTTALSTFNVESTGYIQGQALDQPAVRFSLSGGVLASTETLPMWGGCAISEAVPPAMSSTTWQPSLGGAITRATNVTANTAGMVTGFSVFDQDHSMINTPQSPVPLIGSGSLVNFYRLGSGARISVKCDPNLVSLQTGVINPQVSWDYANQQLVPYSSTTISSGTYTSGTGAVALTTAANHGLLPGDTFELNTMTGTGSYALLNGEWTATTGTTGTTLNFTGPVGATLTITGGNVVTGGLLAVSVLDVQVGNCMTVTYNSSTGFATWNYGGTCAVILI